MRTSLKISPYLVQMIMLGRTEQPQGKRSKTVNKSITKRLITVCLMLNLFR